ncbi:MAG: hypothetical protein DHS20C10_10080 [marine bacterium B5-7]|nr:MAG: hypothetical protein DHS20C10_10080 [marine bacterium B5-7]
MLAPQLRLHRENVAQLLSRIVQHPVEIGDLHASWVGVLPELNIERVKVLSTVSRQTVLRIASIHLVPDIFQSIWQWHFVPKTLVVRGVDIGLQRTPDGHFVFLDKKAKPPHVDTAHVQRVTLALLGQGHFVLRDAHVHWLRKSGEVITAGPIDVDVINHKNKHHVVLAYSKQIVDFHFNQNLQEVRIPRLSLKNIQPLLLLSLPGKWQTVIKKLNPRGDLNNVLIRHTGTWEAWSRAYLVKANLSHIAWSAYQHFPGFAHLDAHVLLRPTQGRFRMDSHNASIQLPGFKHPLMLSDFTGLLNWRETDKGWQVSSPAIRVKNAEGELVSTLDLEFPYKSSPTINFWSAGVFHDTRRIAYYYPELVMASPLLDWLNTAIGPSDWVDVGMHLQGPLNKFPFDHGEGESRILGHIHGASLKYAPDWPAINDLNATLMFDKRHMTITSDHGNILGTHLAHADVQLKHLGEDKPLDLQVKGIVDGDLTQAWQFVQKSPVKTILGGKKSLTLFKPEGAYALQLGLSIPLSKPENTAVNGDLSLLNAQLAVPTWRIVVNKLLGHVHFSEHGVQAEHVHGILDGHPLFARVETEKAGTSKQKIVATLRGHMDVAKLATRYHTDLQHVFSGGTDYKLTLKLMNQQMPNQYNEAIFTSNLRGLAMHLPSPLEKPASISRQCEIHAKFSNHKPLNLSWDYAHFLKGIVQFHHEGSQLSFDRGDVVLGHPRAVLPKKSGLRFLADTKRLQTAGWLHMPTNHPLDLHFSKLYISPKSTGKNTHLTHPPKLPAMQIRIDDLRYQGRQLGHVLAKIKPVKSGIKINPLRLQSPLYDLHAQAQWTQKPHQTQFKGTLDTQDLGKMLLDEDLYDNIRGSSGRAKFNLAWPGSPLDLDKVRMSGYLNLDFLKGRIVGLSKKTNQQLGLGKILNLLSLQTLPQRLSLNFSDVTEKGYDFDKLKGDLDFQHGVISTKNTFVDGPVAFVGLSGKIDMGHKQFDLLMKVIPYITSSIPLVATIAGGPVAGAVAWVANKVFSHQIHDITAHVYKVSGPWDHPGFKQVSAKQYTGRHDAYQAS